MSVIFEFDGCEYMALDAGPHFKLNETFSLLVSCEDQAEVDRFWDAHSDDCRATKIQPAQAAPCVR